MSEYRTTATLTEEGTFVVPSPERLPAGTRIEVVLHLPSPAPESHPLTSFLDDLRLRPVDEAGRRRAEASQAALRELRQEWDGA